MIKTEGIVLSKRNSYNEDVFLTLFTEKFGKMNVVVKRSKSYRSSLNASTRIFVCSDYILRPAIGPSAVPSVIGADIVHSNLRLLDDLECIANASYLCELVNMTTVEENSEKTIYLLLKEGLLHIAAGEIDRSLLRAFFLANLCRELGVMPNTLDDEHNGVLRSFFLDRDQLSRCVRFLHYLADVNYSRLRHTKRDQNLFSGAIAFCEMILKETLGISDIRSNRLI